MEKKRLLPLEKNYRKQSGNPFKEDITATITDIKYNYIQYVNNGATNSSSIIEFRSSFPIRVK